MCQSSPADVQALVYDAYGRSDYSFITSPPGTSVWADRIGDAYLKRVAALATRLAGASVVEIGAGTSYIAEKALQTYDIADYTIVDPAIRASGRDERLRVLNEYFDPNVHGRDRFDWALSFNCLEHVPDALKFLKDVRASLRAGGGLFFVFPDIEEQFLRGDVGALLHEHISYFTRESVSSLFRRAGFSVEVIESCADELTVLAMKTGEADESEFQASTEFLSASFDRMKDNAATYADRIQTDLRSGMRVAFHGANNSLNNFLFMTSLGDWEGLMIFDGDQSKEGRFLPCSRHAIRHAADHSYRDADRVYVSASTFFQEIRNFLITQHEISDSAILSIFGAPSRASLI